MIYELRSYDINPNRWEEYGKWAQELAFPLFFEHFKLPLVGFWETLPVEDTPTTRSTQLLGSIGYSPGRASRHVTGGGPSWMPLKNCRNLFGRRETRTVTRYSICGYR